MIVGSCWSLLVLFGYCLEIINSSMTQKNSSENSTPVTLKNHKSKMLQLRRGYGKGWSGRSLDGVVRSNGKIFGPFFKKILKFQRFLARNCNLGSEIIYFF